MYTNMSHYVLIEGIASLIFENISKTLIKNRNTIPFTVDSIKGTIFHKSITEKFDIPYFEDKRKLALLVSDVIVVLKMDWRLSARPVRGPNEKNFSLGFWLSEPYFNSTRFPGPSSIGTTEMFPNLDDMPRLVPLFTSIVMKKLVTTQPYVVDNLRSLLNDKESPTTKALDLKPFKNKKEMEVVCRALVEALKLNPDLEFDAETFTQVGQIKPCEVFWLKNGSRVPNINKPSTLSAAVGLVCNTAVNLGDENMTSDRRSPRTRLLARDSEFYESPMYLAIVGRLASHFAGKALEVIEPKIVENEQTTELLTYPVAAMLEVLRKGEDIVTTTVNPADQTAISKTVSLSDLYEFHHVDVTQLLYDVHLAMRQLRVMKYNSVRGKLELGFFSARAPLPTGEDANESSSLTTAVVSSASSVSSLSDGGSSSDASVGRFGNLQSQLQLKTVSPPPLLSFGSVSRSPTSIQAVDRISVRSQETKQISFPPAQASFFGSNTVGYTHNQPQQQQQQQQQKQLLSMGQELPSHSHNQNFYYGTKFTGYQQLLQQSQQQSQSQQQPSQQENTQVFRLVHESYQQAPQQQHQQLQQTQQHQYRIVGSRPNPQQKPDCFKSQLSTPPHHHGQHDPTQYQQGGHPRTRFNTEQMQQFDYQRHLTGTGASGGGAGAAVGLGGGYPLSQRNPFKVQQQPQQHQIQQQPRYQLQQQQQQSSYLPHAHHELQRAEQQRYFEGRKVQQTEMLLAPPLHPQTQQQQQQRPIGYTPRHKATEQHTQQQNFNPLDIFTQHSDLSRVQPFNCVDDSFSLNTNRSASDDSYSLFNNNMFDCAKPFDSLQSSFVQNTTTAAPKRRQPADELWGSVNGELLW